MDEILKLFGGAENIWAAIQQNAGKVGVEATRMMLELFYVLKSPETGMLDKTLIVTALGYQLLPEDVLPRDKYGFLGFLDNVVTIGFAYKKVKSSVTPQIENQVNNILAQWFGEEAQPQQQLPPQQSNWTPNAQPIQQPVFTPQQPVFTTQQPQVTPTPRPSKPWDDDEDVVID